MVAHGHDDKPSYRPTKRARAPDADDTLVNLRWLNECPSVLSFVPDEGPRKRRPTNGAADGGSDNCHKLPLLAQLVFPLTPAAFVQRYYRSRVLATHGPASRYDPVAEHLHGLSLPKLLEDSPSEAIHVWVARQLGGSGDIAATPNVAGGSDGGAESFKTDDAAAALTCYRAGASLYFRAPEEVSDVLVTALSQQLGMSFGSLYPDGAPRSEVETFASRTGHVTDWHFDFMENFTLQLSGVKRWRLRRSGVAHPVRGCTPMWRQADATVRDAAEAQAKCHAQHASGPFDAAPPAEQFEGGWEEVILRPGSMLYVPAGTWHRVECEEDSLSINVSLMGLSWADVVGGAITQRLKAHAAARRAICFHSVRDGRAQLEETLAILRAEAAAMAPHDLLPACMPLPRALRVALPLLHERGSDVDWLREDTRYRRNPLAVLLLLPAVGWGEESDEEEEDSGEEEGVEESDAECSEAGSEEGEEEEEAGGLASAARRASLSRAIASLEHLTSASDLLVDGMDPAVLASWNEGSAGEASGEEGEEEESEEEEVEPSEPATYALHAQFGGDDYASLLRVELVAPPPLWRFLDWCRTAAPPTFSKSEALEAAGHDVSVETVAAALGVLQHHGFCNAIQPKPPRARKKADGTKASAKERTLNKRVKKEKA